MFTCLFLTVLSSLVIFSFLTLLIHWLSCPVCPSVTGAVYLSYCPQFTGCLLILSVPAWLAVFTCLSVLRSLVVFPCLSQHHWCCLPVSLSHWAIRNLEYASQYWSESKAPPFWHTTLLSHIALCTTADNGKSSSSINNLFKISLPAYVQLICLLIFIWINAFIMHFHKKSL